MSTLHLNLHRKWFDMIASTEKKEEYREIKPYWTNRLFNKTYNTITFSNGFSKNRKQMVVEFVSVNKGVGNPKWGAPETPVYIITLGKILTKNS